MSIALAPIEIIKEESHGTSYELTVSENPPYGYQIKINGLNLFEECLTQHHTVNFVPYLEQVTCKVVKPGVLKLSIDKIVSVITYYIDLQKPFYIASLMRPPQIPILIQEIIHNAKQELSNNGQIPCFNWNRAKIKRIYYTPRRAFFLVTNEKETKVSIFTANILDQKLKRCKFKDTPPLLENHITRIIKIPGDSREHMLTTPLIHADKKLFRYICMFYDNTVLRQAEV